MLVLNLSSQSLSEAYRRYFFNDHLETKTRAQLRSKNVGARAPLASTRFLARSFQGQQRSPKNIKNEICAR